MVLRWEESSVCSDMDPGIFFPERGEVWKIRKAKQACSDCPVKKECLSFALANAWLQGVWGGYTEQERKKMISMQAAISALSVSRSPS